MARLRNELEGFIKHLAILANIPEQDWEERSGFADKLNYLSDDNIGMFKKNGGLQHYLSFWYKIGCIGVHDTGNEDISLKRHVYMCVEAMRTVIYWYVEQYPPISQKPGFIEKSKKTLEEFKPIDLNMFVSPSKKKVSEILGQYDLAVIHGSSWIGKTSLSCFTLSEFVEENFVPIIFHERNLVSPSPLYEEKSNFPIQRVSLKDKAGALHKEIVTSVFRGDSCVILFDYPFGHRKFQPYNSPLSYLRIADWVKLSHTKKELLGFGSIKIIINTPTKFWEEAKKILKTTEDESISPILKENLEWILYPSNKRAVVQTLSLKDYLIEEVKLIIKNVALTLHCKWSEYPELCDTICDLAAPFINKNCDSFDSLRLFCLDTKDYLEDDKILESIQKYFSSESVELKAQITDLEEDIQAFLIVVYIGEAFEQLSKDYFYSQSNFKDLCNHLRVSDILSKITLDQELFKKLDYWLNFESNYDSKFAYFPRFRHPDIRAAVEVFIRENKGKSIASHLLVNSRFVSCFSPEQRSTKTRQSTIMRWESIYVLCYLAYLIDTETCEYIYNNWFSLPKREFDVDQTLWAISDNWLNIKESPLENFSIAALKRIRNDFFDSRRNFIWEIINNWVHMPEEIRYLVLTLNAKEEQRHKDELTPKINQHHLISFLGAVFCNYRTLTSYLNNNSSESTKVCLEFVNHFVRELSKESNLTKPQYKSYEDDRVFNKIAFYPGKDVLLKVSKMALDSGGTTKEEQIIKNVYAALGR